MCSNSLKKFNDFLKKASREQLEIALILNTERGIIRNVRKIIKIVGPFPSEAKDKALQIADDSKNGLISGILVKNGASSYNEKTDNDKYSSCCKYFREKVEIKECPYDITKKVYTVSYEKNKCDEFETFVSTASFDELCQALRFNSSYGIVRNVRLVMNHMKDKKMFNKTFFNENDVIRSSINMFGTWYPLSKVYDLLKTVLKNSHTEVAEILLEILLQYKWKLRTYDAALLKEALLSEETEAVELLLKHGLDIFCCGEDIIYHMMKTKNLVIFSFLLDNGMKIMCDNESFVLDVLNTFDEEIIGLVFSKNSNSIPFREIIKQLIYLTPCSKELLLKLAIMNGDFYLVKYFIEDLKIKNLPMNESFLLTCCKSGDYPKIIELFTMNDVEIDKDLTQAISICSEKKFEKSYQCLITYNLEKKNLQRHREMTDNSFFERDEMDDYENNELNDSENNEDME